MKKVIVTEYEQLIRRIEHANRTLDELLRELGVQNGNKR